MKTVIMNPKSLCMPRSFETTESNKTGSWRYLRPRYDEKTSPCSATCPAGEDIARVEMLATQGMFKEAWETILIENPLPAVCGRVCFHPCEGVCNRRPFDSSVAIHTIERFVADMAIRNGLRPSLEIRPAKSQKVAIIGSGPAGLSAAWFLAMLGYRCDIFESLSEAGGILRWGIPEYRLPFAVLQSEIARIEGLGVQIFTGKHISEELLGDIKKSYNAVFFGCGYSRSTPLGIPGDEKSTVLDGLTFLRDVRQGRSPGSSGVSAVIGGGNTAVDIARTIMRLGGRAVIVYRRRRQDMPAFEEEVVMALEEGVELRELLAPAEIIRQDGRLLLTLKKMKVEGIDKDGRGRIVPEGSGTIDLTVDRVFAATGSGAAEGWYNPPFKSKGCNVFSHCALVTKKGDPPLLFGGDLANATKNVTQAVASGKQAAIILDTLFTKGTKAIDDALASCRVGDGPALSMEIYTAGPRKDRSAHIVQYEEINTDHFQFEARITQPRLLIEERIGSFEEIDLRISANLAIRESGRCFNCGLCNQCDNCYLFCPDVSVIRGRDGEDRHINYDYCKGCGLCVVECPRNAMTLEEEAI